MEDQREFVEHLQIGKQIGKLLDMPKGSPGPKKHFLGLEYEKVQKVDLLTMRATKQCWCYVFLCFHKYNIFDFYRRFSFSFFQKTVT